MARRPGWACAVLLTLGVVALMLGGLALYGRHAVLDPVAFADRATAALAQDEVMDEIAARIATREIEASPDLAALRPALDAGVAEVIGAPGFASEFHAGALRLHHGLFDGGPSAFVLPGAAAPLRAAVQARSPAAARALPAADPELLRIGGGPLENALRDAAPSARRLSALAPLAVLAGVLLLAAAGRRASTRRLGLRRAALGLALAGGATVAATSVARAIVLSTFDTSHGDAVVSTIWGAFLSDLRLWALAAGALGLVAAAVIEPGRPGAWRRALAAALRPHGGGARLLRAAALVVLAGLLLWMPEVPLDLAVVAAAGLLVFSGAADVVRVAQRSLLR